MEEELGQLEEQVEVITSEVEQMLPVLPGWVMPAG